MNKNRYNLLRLISFMLGIVPSFISLLIARDKKTIIFNSQFNDTFEQNSRSLFLYIMENHPDIPIFFVINDNEKRKALNEKYGEFFITNYRVTDILKIIRASIWVCSSLETPISGVLLRSRRTVVHLGHGAPIKAIGLGERYLNLTKSVYYRIIKTNFSYFMSTSRVFDEAWRACLDLKKEQVIRGPQARNAEVLNSCPSLVSEHLNDRNVNILYAPTWRPFSETELFPFEDFDLDDLAQFLESNNIMIHLRIHPKFETLIDSRLRTTKGINLLSKLVIDDINPILGSFDLLITDYSSIYIDYLLTQKPQIGRAHV